ncbi:hypothetical protein EG68_03268 [Paragonimus skrjabini miyazakii]|uniref:Uncharacterized protein n=1 Tax=Paragonimus skrjabini miyazakii TaxID=59628 RepID=A0A8S9Z5K5_9TREM|nr:hypothetical protein EG68_03268 [Paragonimus skrjabini miyazakii]
MVAFLRVNALGGLIACSFVYPSIQLGMSTAVLRRQSGVLLTEMELVESELDAEPPPNHLVDTNIFSRIGGNDYVQVQPAEIHFAELNNKNKDCRTQMKIVRLTNVSRKATRVNIIPPETSYFSLSYKVPNIMAMLRFPTTMSSISNNTVSDLVSLVMHFYAYKLCQPVNFKMVSRTDVSLQIEK